MHIRLELPRTRLRQWHLWLIEHLTRDGAHSVSITLNDHETPSATALNLLLSLETLTIKGATQAGSKPLTPVDVLSGETTPTEAQPDVIVHIGGTGKDDTGALVLNLVFDDQPHEDALWLALLDRRAPTVGLHDGSTDGQTAHTTQAIALPGLEAPHLLSHSADAVYARAIELIAARIANYGRGIRSPHQTHCTPLEPTRTLREGRALQGTATFLARRVGDKARTILNRVTKSAPQWSVAWRPRRPLSPGATTTLNVQDFHGLHDDNSRYYADPFALDKDGLTHVFVEEFPYATGRGLISTFTINADGHCSTPRPVLETGVHLSYPQVFEHAGDIFMLPEASASGGLDLYRADPFPDRWVHDTRLMDEPLHDATLHFDGARWWLFAATHFLKSSSWCALKVFTADTIRGPWHAISDHPVKVDARSARPAGALVVQDGALWRPAQDCSTGYGHGLTWCQVEALTPEHYSEQALGRLNFTAASTCLGPHTWNATGTIETIDLFAAPNARPRASPSR